jgi:hypothetical protein
MVGFNAKPECGGVSAEGLALDAANEAPLHKRSGVLADLQPDESAMFMPELPEALWCQLLIDSTSVRRITFSEWKIAASNETGTASLAEVT